MELKIIVLSLTLTEYKLLQDGGQNNLIPLQNLLHVKAFNGNVLPLIVNSRIKESKDIP